MGYENIYINGGVAAMATYEEDLKGEWSYKKIFTPSEIPLPASAQGLGAWNRTVYSPAVVKVNSEYFMLFGVSIYCQGGKVARDSIAMARSTNGFDWQFWKYIIESDPKSCREARGDWANDQTHPFTYQTNDPAVYFNPNNSEEILVFYTTVKIIRIIMAT